ncbi:MAG: DUF2752 domain-containing protein [Chryseolinea sp.]
MAIIRRLPFEAIFWATCLCLLALLDPKQTQLSICPLAYMGFDFCPGCGLGRSISLLLHGEFMASIKMHPLGIFGFIVLVHRIFQLIKNQFNLIWQK